MVDCKIGVAINPMKDIGESINLPKKIKGFKMTLVKGKSKLVSDTDSGELHEQIELDRYDVRDVRTFTKVFDECWAIMRGMGKEGRTVIDWIIPNLTRNQVKIYLAANVLYKEMGYSSVRSFQNGVKECVEKGLLFKSDLHDWYYINPNMYFRGERTKVFLDAVQMAKDRLDKENEEKKERKIESVEHDNFEKE